MPTFDVSYLMIRSAKIEAATLEDAKTRVHALMLSAAPAKLLSVHEVGYVEPPKVEEPPPIQRGCQCPDCTSQANFDEWSKPIFARKSYRDVTTTKPDGGGGKLA